MPSSIPPVPASGGCGPCRAVDRAGVDVARRDGNWIVRRDAGERDLRRMNPARSESPSSSTRSANASRGVSSSGSAQMARYSASRESVIKSFNRCGFGPSNCAVYPGFLRVLCRWRLVSRFGGAGIPACPAAPPETGGISPPFVEVPRQAAHDLLHLELHQQPCEITDGQVEGSCEFIGVFALGQGVEDALVLRVECRRGWGRFRRLRGPIGWMLWFPLLSPISCLLRF